MDRYGRHRSVRLEKSGMKNRFESGKANGITLIPIIKNTTPEYKYALAIAIRKYNHIYNITNIYDLFNKQLDNYSIQDLIVASNLAAKQYEREIGLNSSIKQHEEEMNVIIANALAKMKGR